MIVPADLAILVPWIIAHGYLIFLIVATIEGPLTTIAAGVAASLGYFNIWIIMILAVAADISGDFLYYGLGYICHNLTHSRFFRFLGLSEKRLAKIEGLLHHHLRRAVLLVKISPLIGPVGLVAIGAARPKFKKFMETALAIAIPKSLFFVFLGYFSGKTYLQLNQTLADGQYIILGLVLILALAYLAYIKIMSLVSKKLEENK